MNFPPWAIYAYAGTALFMASAWFFARGKVRTVSANALLAVLTLFVVHFMGVAISTQKIGQTNTATAVESAEMPLKLMACFDSLRRRMYETEVEIAVKAHKPVPPQAEDKDKKQREEAFENAEKALTSALEATPKDQTCRAQLIILLGERKGTSDRIAKLTGEMHSSAGEEDHELSLALSHIYVQHEVNKDEVAPFKATLSSALRKGWYREHAIERLYAVARDEKQLKDFLKDIDNRNIGTLVQLCVAVVLLCLAGLIGVVNIFIQLGFVAREGAARVDDVGLDLPLKTIWAVFVCWFTLQIVISTGTHAFIAQNAELLKQPNMVAMTTAITYLVSNVPGALLIYYLAIKPQGLSFVEALRIKPQTSTSGPIKIALMGFLAWCSALPLVIIAAILASRLLHSQNSDNPVIAQIIQAASAANPQAIVVFYFTLGVMAPFFEEILFRGFLYASLKPRVRAFPAMLLSAAAFAMLHFDKGGVLMLFAIGFVLAFTFERSRSLISSMVAHGLWNSGTFTLALVLFSS